MTLYKGIERLIRHKKDKIGLELVIVSCMNVSKWREDVSFKDFLYIKRKQKSQGPYVSRLLSTGFYTRELILYIYLCF